MGENIVLFSCLSNTRAIRSNEFLRSITEGSAPHLIQREHEPICEFYGNSMRFLFELGAVLEPEPTIGDAAMIYILGCDLRPENCAGFIDSH
jgi:hypothetical protein